ncbi:hypothetical protein SISSUDRAFT_1046760 [Sistotremastrum suecicum HHB10207 ss-3]|uniref:DUF6533 domain-containing protein n=1 Tax=Sistotremastrum suecicum HHB10207 ss-3 TaxID=1314776 RepID=A0A166DJW9_9AGAM|nr:hypothetical protein SISSUDRAFT_1046760 [Sistotremastrum suecicum HHB10207 ss-3]
MVPDASIRLSIRTAVQQQTSHLVGISAVCFLIWEIILTIGDEIDLVWRASWNHVKALYYVVRYLGLATVSMMVYMDFRHEILSIPGERCSFPVLFQICATWLAVAAADLLLFLRVRALYHDNRLAKDILTLIFVLHTTSGIVLCGIMFSPGRGCGTDLLIDDVTTMMIPSVIVQAVLFGFTVVRIIKHHIKELDPLAKRPSLFQVFLFDGTWTFAVITGVYMWVIVWHGISPEASAAWLVAALTYASSRLVLNLRVAASALRLQYETHPETITRVVFAPVATLQDSLSTKPPSLSFGDLDEYS